ncbi:MAG: putative ATP-grasp superfamily ATP-dependent carboligase [Planctomycetaceae bacterium]|jgi:predicted ATP-grasp superfamily ATP-dependent carboligase
MSDPEPLIIVGSSVRAAAQSAVRAGFRPWCIDQFGDRDLVEISDGVHTVTDWPNEIASAIQSAPLAEWVYTGALENHPALVEKLSRQRLLCGCGIETLSRLRDPIWLADTLIKASLPSLPVIVPVSGIPESGEWIVKPLASAAGIGVRDSLGRDVGTVDFGGHYLQRKARGRVISGLYLGVENSALLIGMCEQVCRGSDAGEYCYVYSGSFGPLSVAEDSGDVFEQAQRIGSAIAAGVRAEGATLRGLFGIDFVLDDETGELWTLEINPRYTASTEIYEHAFGWPLMRWHVDACRGRSSEAAALLDSRSFDGGWPIYGKLIVYAERDFAAPDIVPLVRRLSFNGHAESSVSVADIPQIETLIQKDEPVCTLLTAQKDLVTCQEILTAASRELLTSIGEFAA